MNKCNLVEYQRLTKGFMIDLSPAKNIAKDSALTHAQARANASDHVACVIECAVIFSGPLPKQITPLKVMPRGGGAQ